MTGKQLLAQLQALTPVQLNFEVVIRGDKGEYFDSCRPARLAHVTDECYEDELFEPNSIAITV